MSSRAGLPPLPRDAAAAGHAGDTSGAQKLIYQHSPSHLRRANRSPPQPEQQLPAAGCSDTRLLRFRIERGSSGRGRKRRCSPGNRPARSPRRHGLPARDPPAPPARIPVPPGSPLPSGLGAKSAAPSRPAATAAAPVAFCLFFMASMAFSLRACLWPL